MANVIFKRGTRAQFDAILEKDSNTLYWLKDAQELWAGDVLYGVGREATAEVAGLLSAEDKAKLDAVVAGTYDLIAGDSSLDIVSGVAKVNISALEDNAVVLKDDGIFVPVAVAPVIPEFTIEKQEVSTDGYAASYKLKRVSGDDVSYVGDVIDIPKDMVLQGGTMETVVIANQPYEGANVGDPYIDLVLSDPNNSHIYIPVKGLVDTVLPGTGISIVDNTVSIKLHSVEANGLFVNNDGLGLMLATRTSAGAMSAEDKLIVESVPYVLERKRYEISNKPEGILVDYRDKEIRIMCPSDTEWSLQNTGAGADPNCYYIGFKAYAPEDGIVSFKEDMAEKISDNTMHYFEDNDFAGIDKFGRKYSIVWLALARYEDGVWTYYGASSSSNKYIGWYYSVEWYNAAGKVVASDMIRINLSNESCHHTIAPTYVTTLTNEVEDIKETISVLEQTATWSDM